MTWSFSRLNGFYKCKRSWYIQYVLSTFYREKYKRSIKKIDKFFGLYGTYAHKILDLYNKNELELYELYDFCNSNYECEIPVYAPPNKYVNIYESYKEKLLNFFNTFVGERSDYKIINSEFEVSFNIKINSKTKIKFRGYVDLLLEDADGNLIIKDYKTKSDFANEEEKKEYFRQLYLYSLGIYETYGKYPTLLVFDMVKINKCYTLLFNKEELEESIKWVSDTIKDIKKETNFGCMNEEPEKNFFCRYVCSFGTDVCNQVENDECIDLEDREILKEGEEYSE